MRNNNHLLAMVLLLASCGDDEPVTANKPGEWFSPITMECCECLDSKMRTDRPDEIKCLKLTLEQCDDPKTLVAQACDCWMQCEAECTIREFGLCSMHYQ